nr:MAG TPA: hypothetical protein [Crassvirales sp.]
MGGTLKYASIHLSYTQGSCIAPISTQPLWALFYLYLTCYRRWNSPSLLLKPKSLSFINYIHT